MSAAPVEAVVFDVGHVLVGADYGPFLAFLRAHGVRFADMDEVCERVRLDEHEAGALDGPRFLARMAGLGTRPMDEAALLREWNAMYHPAEAMLALARGLKDAHRVYLLSNMGDLHWAHLERAFGIPSLAHDALASWTAGVLKPDPRIYAAAERRFGLDPARTLFVDDRADNVAAARARGWRAVRHVGHARTREALAALGLVAGDAEPPCTR